MPKEVLVPRDQLVNIEPPQLTTVMTTNQQHQQHHNHQQNGYQPNGYPPQNSYPPQNGYPPPNGYPQNGYNGHPPGYPPGHQYYGGHYNGTTAVVVRGEEIGIVLVVLVLWVGAIILFFNRWGKIRMLEPYQPKFCEHHNPNCPMADPIPPITTNYPRTFSKFNLSSETGGSPHFSKCNYHGVNTTTTTTCVTEPLLNGGSGSRSMSMVGGLGVPGGLTYSPRLGGRGGQNRLRQNSVFVPNSPNFSGVSLFGDSGGALGKSTTRKTKSAVDLSTLVLCGEFMDNVRRNSKNSLLTNL